MRLVRITFEKAAKAVEALDKDVSSTYYIRMINDLKTLPLINAIKWRDILANDFDFYTRLSQ